MSISSSPVQMTRHLSRIYDSIAADLDRAEVIFREELGSRHPFVQLLVDHSAGFGGKRLRPALVFLAAKASGGIRYDHDVLAAVVEMIHAATLIHDDILDEAETRRHLETVNAKWSNRTAVLLGDYLFTHAFHLAASLDSTLACRWIGRATNLVCEGEMIQVHNQGNLELDEEVYLEIIGGKTAELVAVSCQLGAHYSGAETVVVDSLHRYGRLLGMAFQIADDVLDIWGEEQLTGKTLGTDLDQGKLTLPIIHLLRSADESRRSDYLAMISDPDRETRNEIRSILETSGSLESAWNVAEELVVSAQSELQVLTPSEDRNILELIAERAIHRST